MSWLRDLLVGCWELLNIRLSIFDLDFSFAQIFLWTMIAGAVVYLVVRWFGD